MKTQTKRSQYSYPRRKHECTQRLSPDTTELFLCKQIRSALEMITDVMSLLQDLNVMCCCMTTNMNTKHTTTHNNAVQHMLLSPHKNRDVSDPATQQHHCNIPATPLPTHCNTPKHTTTHNKTQQRCATHIFVAQKNRDGSDPSNTTAALQPTAMSLKHNHKTQQHTLMLCNTRFCNHMRFVMRVPPLQPSMCVVLGVVSLFLCFSF